MSSFLDKVLYLFDYGWAVWCGLLRSQMTWWDPYGAALAGLLLLVFLGLAFKVVRE